MKPNAIGRMMAADLEREYAVVMRLYEAYKRDRDQGISHESIAKDQLFSPAYLEAFRKDYDYESAYLADRNVTSDAITAWRAGLV